MNNKITILFAVLVMSLLNVAVAPAQIDTLKVMAELEKSLKSSHTASDSIAPLYNLIDLKANSPDASAPMWELYGVAGRAGDTHVRLDMMRNLANAYFSVDSVLAFLEEAALAEPTSDEQRETLTFIRVNRNSLQHKFATEEERQQMLTELFRNITDNSSQSDIYDQIRKLFALVEILGGETQGDLLTKYFGQLEDLIGQLPEESYALRNKFYTNSAISYTYSGDCVRAANADRALLAIMKNLETKYSREGRPYRHYDKNRYICYRRLLNNYKALTDEETETYYKNAKALADSNPFIGEDFYGNQRPTICYLMKNKRYAEAIPLIKAQIPKANSFYLRRFLMSQLRHAAREAGDHKTLFEITDTYNTMLEEYIEHKSAERYKELEIIYEVNSLRASNNELEKQRQRGRTQGYISALIVGSVALLVCIVLAILLLGMYRRSCKLAKELKASADKIRAERDALAAAQKSLIEARDMARVAERQKEEFIGNMSHEVMNPLNTIVEYSQIIVDCIDDTKHRYLDKFARIVTINADLLQTLFKDVLNISSLEHSQMSVTIKPTSINDICEISVESSRRRLNPGVKMEFLKKDEPDLIVMTDGQRVEMVLVNLLQNAAKFTEEGMITLDYSLDSSGDTLTFAVTDTGIGIPEGKESQIFERFEKLNKYTQGIGLGLPICRLLATLLGGDVKVDTTYREGGARFLFSIPVRKK